MGEAQGQARSCGAGVSVAMHALGPGQPSGDPAADKRTCRALLGGSYAETLRTVLTVCHAMSMSSCANGWSDRPRASLKVAPSRRLECGHAAECTPAACEGAASMAHGPSRCVWRVRLCAPSAFMPIKAACAAAFALFIELSSRAATFSPEGGGSPELRTRSRSMVHNDACRRMERRRRRVGTITPR